MYRILKYIQLRNNSLFRRNSRGRRNLELGQLTKLGAQGVKINANFGELVQHFVAGVATRGLRPSASFGAGIFDFSSTCGLRRFL
jgi:hypothetical protein